ncbi:hypothetical protein BLOT_005575 [Blomia tropicalis]|nr:hypothetical protein BLOT_005575 [Blomia tropicalis]
MIVQYQCQSIVVFSCTPTGIGGLKSVSEDRHCVPWSAYVYVHTFVGRMANGINERNDLNERDNCGQSSSSSTLVVMGSQYIYPCTKALENAETTTTTKTKKTKLTFYTLILHSNGKLFQSLNNTMIIFISGHNFSIWNI